MTQKTILNQKHRDAGARMVDFGGWDMPVNYGSQVDEHHSVREGTGVFDVSHMTIVDAQGNDAKPFLQTLLANDVAKLTVSGKALYSCMLNDQAGVIDDLIVYYIDDSNYRLVVNASTREKDLNWINQQAADFDVTITEQPELAMLAVQGPQARDRIYALLSPELAADAAQLKPFHACWHQDWFIGRTGYTGEDGFEIMLPAAHAEAFWDQILAAGIQPCGLGARDTLRLEAGMNLYGSDMDETKHPLESGLGWTIAWEPTDRDFVGRAALETIRQSGESHRFVGLVLEDKGVLRGHQRVVLEDGSEGEITSGGFSPTLGRSIAFARVPKNVGQSCQVDIRGKLKPARVVKTCFVRNGTAQLEL